MHLSHIRTCPTRFGICSTRFFCHDSSGFSSASQHGHEPTPAKPLRFSVQARSRRRPPSERLGISPLRESIALLAFCSFSQTFSRTLKYSVNLLPKEPRLHGSATSLGFDGFDKDMQTQIPLLERLPKRSKTKAAESLRNTSRSDTSLRLLF